MLKKIFVFFFCFLICVISVLQCFAIEGTFDDTHYVVADDEYIINKFSRWFGFNENKELDSDTLAFLRDRVATYPDEIQVLLRSTNNLEILCMGNDTYRNGLSFYNSKGDYDVNTIGCLRFRFPSIVSDTSYFSSASSNTNTYTILTHYLLCTNENDLALYVHSDDYYTSDKTSHSDWEVDYYDGNILKAILDYYDSLHGQQFYDVDNVDDGTYIKYYSAFDSYKGAYNNKFYGDDDIRNYLNSSVVFDDSLVNVYYSSDIDTVETADYYQHKEDITFYVQFKNETTHNSLSALSDRATVMNLMNSCTSVKHYTQNVISFSTWFDSLGINYYVNDKHQFQFTMSNSYTYMNTLFQGSKVFTNATLIVVDGGTSDDGFGNLSGIDGDVGTKQELKNKGWSNGYPNTADYPYRIDIYKNAEKYLQIYFKSKPDVVSYFYTDSQIKYTIDMTSAVGYFYSVPYNLSSSFDFSEIEKMDKSWLVAIIDKIDTENNINLVDLQNFINDTYGSQNFISGGIDIVYNIAKLYLDMDNDIDNIQRKRFVIWTNYTGDINRTNWTGYHCRFNWDIDIDSAFTRGNSDDTHNYHSDVVKDILSDAEIATELSTSIDEQGNIVSSYNTTYNYYNYYYSDNNGNTHGGGDNTYIATEPPTASELVYQNAVSDFDFNAPTLWNYASSAMNFCKSAFTVFPAFIWLLIASGIVLVIALRLLGR